MDLGIECSKEDIPCLAWRVVSSHTRGSESEQGLMAEDQSTAFNYDGLRNATKIHLMGWRTGKSPWISLTSSLLWALARAAWLERQGAVEIHLLLIETHKVPDLFPATRVKRALELGHGGVPWFNDVDHEYLAWQRIPDCAVVQGVSFPALKNPLDIVFPTFQQIHGSGSRDVLDVLRQPFRQLVGTREHISPRCVDAAKTLGVMFTNGDNKQAFLVTMAFLALMPRSWGILESQLIARAFEGEFSFETS